MTRPKRAFVTPEPDEDWNALARRVLPQEAEDAAIQKLRSWNLHLFARIPPGEFLNSDVLFVEPPQAADAGTGDPPADDASDAGEV